jgi:hypothetical protein
MNMKNTIKHYFSGLLLVCMLMSICSIFVSAAAVEPDGQQSSAYLESYSADTTVGSNGKVYISVSVDACVYTTQVGAKLIYLYESTNGTSFTKVATFDAINYPDMLCSGWSYFDTPIEYQGVAGRYYWSAVKCYAADAYGSDYRWYDTVVAH